MIERKVNLDMISGKFFKIILLVIGLSLIHSAKMLSMYSFTAGIPATRICADISTECLHTASDFSIKISYNVKSSRQHVPYYTQGPQKAYLLAPATIPVDLSYSLFIVFNRKSAFSFYLPRLFTF